jgi:hypothetical protein
MTAFGADGIQRDLSGKFNFARYEIPTTTLFWTNLKMDAASDPTILVPEHKSTMRHIPKHRNIQISFYFIQVHNYAFFLYIDKIQRHYRFYQQRLFQRTQF